MGRFNWFLILMILHLAFVSGADQIISLTYNFENSTTYERIISFDSVLIKVFTPVDSVCKYSVNKGTAYRDMEGNFDPSLGKIHEKTFLGLEDGGIYNYFIKCVENPDNLTSEPPELEVRFKVDELVSADISLSKKAPLKAGPIEVTLLLSKPVAKKPTLLYSFDGLVYNPVFLTGSEKVWRGHVIVPDDIEEAVLSFKFKGVDLEGRVGEIINTGESFIVDNVKPTLISDIKAIGYEDKVVLSWHYDEEVKEFRIYRSDSDKVDYTDFYDSTESLSYHDSMVERGKTYYYRISAVDAAGNEGPLSKVISATVLLGNVSQENGLSLELRGFVDNLISEVDSVLEEVNSITDEYSTDTTKKKFFEELQLTKRLSDKKRELEVLKREIEKLKSQRLSKEELEKRLSSYRLKLTVIKKGVPESVVIREEAQEEKQITEETISNYLPQIYPDMEDYSARKSLKQTLDLIETSGLKVKSHYFIVDVLYLDGSKDSFSIIERDISATLERMDDTFFFEVIPKNVAEKVSDIKFVTSWHKIIKEDPIVSFESDIKKIIYYVPEEVDISSLRDSQLVLIKLFQENESSSITSYFSYPSFKDYFGIWAISLVFASMFLYLVYLKIFNKSENYFKVLGRLERALDFIEKGDIDSAYNVYSSLVILYGTLKKREKKKIYRKIEELHNAIILLGLEKRLQKFREKKDRESYSQLIEYFDRMPSSLKLNFETMIEKIRREFENEL